MIENEAADKQSIKSQRVKSYFIQAAKDIIKSEGIENISVRKIADMAGYSYTSIYNYYSDLNELLREVKSSMIGDLAQNLQGKMPMKVHDLDDVKSSIHLYINYYMENPNIFRFFYSYRFGSDISKPVELPDFEKGWRETYRGFVEKGVIKESDIVVLSKTIIYTVQGILAIYFTDNGLTLEALYEDIDNIIEYLLKGRYQP